MSIDRSIDLIHPTVYSDVLKANITKYGIAIFCQSQQNERVSVASGRVSHRKGTNKKNNPHARYMSAFNCFPMRGFVRKLDCLSVALLLLSCMGLLLLRSLGTLIDNISVLQ